MTDIPVIGCELFLFNSNSQDATDKNISNLGTRWFASILDTNKSRLFQKNILTVLEQRTLCITDTHTPAPEEQSETILLYSAYAKAFVTLNPFFRIFSISTSIILY